MSHSRLSAAPRLLIVSLLLALTAGIILTVLLFGDILFTRSAVVPVPNLTGKTLAAAEALDSRVFQRVVVEQYSDEPIGTIIAQSPSADSRRKAVPGKRFVSLTLYVSRGPAVSTLPSVVGLPEERARATLCQHRFVTASVYVYDSSPVGTVIAQTPTAQNTEREGTTVTLTVSRGPLLRTVAMPNLRGLSLVEAESLLASLGLYVKTAVTEESPESSDTPRVLRQDPLPGVPITAHSGVTLTVAVRTEETPALPESAPPSDTTEALPSIEESTRETEHADSGDSGSDHPEDSALSPEELLRRLLDRLEATLP